MSNKHEEILVSISCITYNHKKYIRRALDGFLMQRTNFKFEVLVHDDASNDGTTEIIKEYEKKYPEIIKPIYQTENQYSKGITGISRVFNFPRAKGKYLALCEGDDYWTDETKLQQQVDYLENRPGYSICFHPVNVVFENGKVDDVIWPTADKKFNLKNLLQDNFIPTSSVLYRKQDYSKLASGIMPGDWYLSLFHAKFGKIGFINKVMSVYYRHERGVWFDAHNNAHKLWLQHGMKFLELDKHIVEMFRDKDTYKSTIDTRIYNNIKHLADIDKKYESNLIAEAAVKFPQFISIYVDTSITEITKLNMTIDKIRQERDAFWKASEVHKDTVEKRDETIAGQRLEVQGLHDELEVIRSSRIWRVRGVMKKILGRKS